MCKDLTSKRWAVDEFDIEFEETRRRIDEASARIDKEYDEIMNRINNTPKIDDVYTIFGANETGSLKQLNGQIFTVNIFEEDCIELTNVLSGDSIVMNNLVAICEDSLIISVLDSELKAHTFTRLSSLLPTKADAE